MKKLEWTFFLSIIVVVILITFKIWIKMTFEIQVVGLILLIAASWTLKYFIFKWIKKKAKKKNGEPTEIENDEQEKTDDEKSKIK